MPLTMVSIRYQSKVKCSRWDQDCCQDRLFEVLFQYEYGKARKNTRRKEEQDVAHWRIVYSTCYSNPPSLSYSSLHGLCVSPLPRMKPVMNGLEPRPIDVGVDLRGGDISVAEHGLYRSQVGPSLQ